MKARVNYRQMIGGKLHTQQLVVEVLEYFNGGILVRMNAHIDDKRTKKCIATENIIEFINE